MPSPIPTSYIILRQNRQEKAFKSPSGDFPHTIVDFFPIGKPLDNINSPEEALELARLRFPTFPLIAVQPLKDYLECHQPPKLSRLSPNSSEQKRGR